MGDNDMGDKQKVTAVKREVQNSYFLKKFVHTYKI